MAQNQTPSSAFPIETQPGRPMPVVSPIMGIPVTSTTNYPVLTPTNGNLGMEKIANFDPRPLTTPGLPFIVRKGGR